MKQHKLLLIDLSQDGKLAVPLTALLSADNRWVLRNETVAASGLPELDTQLSFNLSERTAFDAVLLCGSGNSFESLSHLLRGFRSLKEVPPTIVVTDLCEPEQLLKLLRAGATEFLLPPLDAAHVLPRLQHIIELFRAEDAEDQQLKETLGLKGFVGESPALLAEIRKIPIIARCDASALITGETGTGKELCARAVHYLSLRAGKPFVSVNCGAIPCDLVENELFGHEPGAYTGAMNSSSGLIQEAEGGTLFLDEIDSLPLLAQVKLLRFLQEKEYRRLGSRKNCRANVRVIAAANTNVEQTIHTGRFRQDLYYRLNTVTLSLPPLRERIGDIALLARHFVRKCAQHLNKSALQLTSSAIQRLISHNWPGNVRELENVIMQSVLLAPGPLIQSADLPISEGFTSLRDATFQELKAQVVSQFERRYLTEMLSAFEGNISRAAAAAHKNRRAFWQLMRKHGIRGCARVQSTIAPAVACM
jgi:DNA-binding NtrC family response regulator